MLSVVLNEVYFLAGKGRHAPLGQYWHLQQGVGQGEGIAVRASKGVCVDVCGIPVVRCDSEVRTRVQGLSSVGMVQWNQYSVWVKRADFKSRVKQSCAGWCV